MQIRIANVDDATAAATLLRRSIVELCNVDHRDDAEIIAAWTANKTPENFCKWIAADHVLVAVEIDGLLHGLLGVAAMTATGDLTLNNVSPDAQFRGVSKALLAALETHASGMGINCIRLTSTTTAHRFYLAAGYEDAGPPDKGFSSMLGFPMAKTLRDRSTRP